MPSVSIVARSAALLGGSLARAGLNRVYKGGSSIPLTAADVTPAWLESAMSLSPGTLTSVTVDRHDSGTAGRARLKLTAKAGSDVPEYVFLKFTPTNLFQAVLMSFMDLGAREVLFYDAVADDVPVRVPRCYSAQIDLRRARNVMVLEDLSPTARFRDVRESVTQEEAEAVIDAMAALHAAYWQSERFKGDLKPLTGRSEVVNVLGNTVRRKLMTDLKGEAAEMVPAEVAEQSRIWFERADEIDAFLASEAITLTHGDSHLGNLFFEGPKPGWLDWQMVMAAPGIRDVSYFCVMSVEPELLRSIEKDLVTRYVNRLAELGVTTDPDRQWTMYRAMAVAPYASALATATSNGRMQPMDIARAGTTRAVAAAQAHDSFRLLGELLDARAAST